jgi:hypothetical protein
MALECDLKQVFKPNIMKKQIMIINCLLVAFMLYGQQANVSSAVPTPKKTKERLFYIQKSSEKNTIVYDAKFDSKGNLVADNPVDVYWIAFEEGGIKKELGSLERHFIYGCTSEKLNNSKFDYKVTLAATDKRAIYLKQVSPYKVKAFIQIRGEHSIIDHVYVKFNDESYFTEIKYVEIFATDSSSNKKINERVYL